MCAVPSSFWSIDGPVEASSVHPPAVGSLRSEYLDQLVEAAASHDLQIQAEVLAPLSRNVLLVVISSPARLAGLRIDDGLAARTVDDAGKGSPPTHGVTDRGV